MSTSMQSTSSAPSEDSGIAYKIVSNDDQVFRMPSKALAMSQTLSDCICLVGCPEKAEEMDPVPIAKVDGATFNRIVEFCTKHMNDEKVDEKAEGKDQFRNVTEWDIQFFKMTPQELFDLIEASNYLNIPVLMHIACKAAANLIMGKTIDELRVDFSIKTVEEVVPPEEEEDDEDDEDEDSEDGEDEEEEEDENEAEMEEAVIQNAIDNIDQNAIREAEAQQ